MSVKIEDSVSIYSLVEQLKDADYFEAWKNGIATTFTNEILSYRNNTRKKHLSRTDLHVIAHNAANAFLNSLCIKTEREEKQNDTNTDKCGETPRIPPSL